MKKQLSIFLLLLTLMSMTGIKAYAHDFAIVNADGKTIYYIYNSDGATVSVSYRGGRFWDFSDEYSGDIVIPESVIYNGKTYSVTSLEYEAFRSCSELTSVVIPNSVTSIGDLAFYECSGLTSVTIGNSVTSIGGLAFYGTGWYNNQPDGILYLDNCLIGYKGEAPMGKLIIEDDTRVLASSALYGCSELISITIPNSVTSICHSAFEGCSSLTSITIPNGVTSIERSAFEGCSSLTSVTIPNGVTSIESSTFSGCSSLSSVTIPNSVTSIGERAFYYCSSLTSLAIPNSVTSIGYGAFSKCIGLTSITIPNSVMSIGDEAFSWCTELTSITIPNSVTSIGSSAFRYCNNINAIFITDLEAWCKISFGNNSLPNSSHKVYLNDIELTNLVIPNSITNLSTYAFRCCSSLTAVKFPESMTIIDESLFSYCTNLISVELPNDLTIIKKQAFQGCSSLKSITLPSTVEYIYQQAFADCYSLESVKVLATIPPFAYDNSFSKYEIPLYVPEGNADAYQEASPWNKFTSYGALCQKPTITLENNVLHFSCDTEDVEYHYTISNANPTGGVGNDLAFSQTFIISVYAAKEGCLDSPTAFLEIGPSSSLIGDVNQDGVVSITDAVSVVNIILNDEAAAPAMDTPQEEEPEAIPE